MKPLVLFFVISDYKAADDGSVKLAMEVDQAEMRYFTEEVLPALKPIDDKTYVERYMRVRGSMARSSLVLDASGDGCVYGCVEWEPGLLVLRFSPDGTMMAAELPDTDNHDFDEAPPQYNLSTIGFDAEVEPEGRGDEWRSLDADMLRRFEAALIPVNALIEKFNNEYSEK